MAVLADPDAPIRDPAGLLTYLDDQFLVYRNVNQMVLTIVGRPHRGVSLTINPWGVLVFAAKPQGHRTVRLPYPFRGADLDLALLDLKHWLDDERKGQAGSGSVREQ